MEFKRNQLWAIGLARVEWDVAVEDLDVVD
jgi:hypothetical protein